MKKPQEHTSARDLYFQTGHSQAEIARQVGVEPKTVNLWVKHGKWKEIKEAARRTPAILVEQYYGQLAELNNAIAARDEGLRYPSLKEAETMRKIIVCINSIQKQVSLGTSIDVVQGLINRIGLQDIELAQKIVDPANDFLRGPARNGFQSHEPAYDAGYEDTSPQPASLRGTNLAERSHERERVTQQSHDNTTTQHGQSIVNEQLLSSDETELAAQAPSLFLGKACPEFNSGVSEGRKGQLAQDDHSHNMVNDQSCNDTETTQLLSFGETGERSSLQSNHSHNIVNDQSTNGSETTEHLSFGETGEKSPKCTRDPDDPYTFYYDKITKRRSGSPKYGLPPEGFREVPRKDPLT